MKKIFLLYFIHLICLGCVLAQERIALSELNLRLMTAGYGSAQANRSIDRNPITLQGKIYQGVGTHADSKIIISLEGRAKNFSALVGVDDEATERGSVIFRIEADGKELYKSPLMRKGQKPAKVNVNLKGVNIIVLEALSGGDGNNNDHADWAEAYFEMVEGKPVAVPDAEIINIGTDNFLLVYSVDKEGNLMQQYLGKKGGIDMVYSRGERKDPAYPTIQSSSRYVYWGEPALHVIHGDGHMSTVLKYVEHTVEKIDKNVSQTVITLKDPVYPFYTDIFLKTFSKENVIEQWTEIYHQESAPVVVKQAASSALTFRAGDYWLTQFTGDWMNEFNVDEYPLTVGSKVLENKWGITSSNARQPHFMISLDRKASETEGEVLAASLAWSGNYSLKFERATYGQLTAISGMNPWSSDYTLPANQRYVTPSLIFTYSTDGKGQASRNLHRWALSYNIRDGYTPLRTIFNNWEATGMDTSDERIIPFLRPAHDLGFELFLLDDGWFGSKDKARILGEWDPTPMNHPKGMKPIIDEAGKVGIDFGLWVEMEMANPEARLVAEHPEWLLTDTHRTPHLQRGQYVLDLSNPAVQDFCINAFHKILEDNPGITFVKWDCNSPFHNPYSHYLGKYQQHLWYEYTLGLYRIFEQCVYLHPDLQMMICSGGGGRCDYGSLRYFHEFWTSDNTNPMSRVFIQWGASHIFPAKTHGAHVTHMGNMPFKFAFDVAMSGCLGMDADPTKMTDEEKKVTSRAIEAYKNKLRPIVQFGDLHRLVSPYETTRSVISYVEADSKKKAVVFVYQVKDDVNGVTVGLQGLDPQKIYIIEEVNIDSADVAKCRQHGQVLSGRHLMDTGLSFDCIKRLDSATVYLAEKE